jgi:hypothetical protein
MYCVDFRSYDISGSINCKKYNFALILSGFYMEKIILTYI